jgi:hypothetical protein
VHAATECSAQQPTKQLVQRPSDRSAQCHRLHSRKPLRLLPPTCQHVPIWQAAHPVLRSTISHSTPAEKRPASAAMSTAASVCPRRFSTPPSRARSVATCPGRLKSAACAAGSASARQVAAL